MSVKFRFVAMLDNWVKTVIADRVPVIEHAMHLRPQESAIRRPHRPCPLRIGLSTFPYSARVIFEIGILDDDDLGPRFLDAGAQRGALAHVHRMIEEADALVPPPRACAGPPACCRFEQSSTMIKFLDGWLRQNAPDDLRHRGGLVVDRHDHRQAAAVRFRDLIIHGWLFSLFSRRFDRNRART